MFTQYDDLTNRIYLRIARKSVERYIILFDKGVISDFIYRMVIVGEIVFPLGNEQFVFAVKIHVEKLKRRRSISQ